MVSFRFSTSPLLVLAFLGCGRVGFDHVRDDDAGLDGPSGAFGPPMLLTPVSGPLGDDDPALTGDLLEIYFDGPDDLFRATRASITGAWNAPATIPELQSSGNDDSPNLSSDGLTLTLASDRGALSSTDFFITTRPTRTSPWGTPARIAELSSVDDEQDLSFSADGLLAMFVSSRGGSSDVYTASRAATTSPWGTPVLVAELSTPDTENAGTMTPDGLSFVFSSDRNGGYDLFVATRTSTAAPFSEPVMIEELSLPNRTESDPWMSADGSLIVFTIGGTDDRDLYVATRP